MSITTDVHPWLMHYSNTTAWGCDRPYCLDISCKVLSLRLESPGLLAFRTF